MRIIVLEDNADLARELSAILQDGGHRVDLVTADAEEAVRFAALHKPDLLLADIELGEGGNGIEAAVALRKMIGMKCVFLTAYSDPETRDQSQQAWPSAYLQKPVAPELLLNLLRGLSSELQDGWR